VVLFQHLNQKELAEDDSVEEIDRFFGICRSANSKPLWQGYSESQSGAQQYGF